MRHIEQFRKMGPGYFENKDTHGERSIYFRMFILVGVLKKILLAGHQLWHSLK